MRRYQATVTRISRTKATPSGVRGTVRQKHQNRTWKFMRVRGGLMPRIIADLAWQAGKLRFDERNLRDNARDVRDAEWTRVLRSRR